MARLPGVLTADPDSGGPGDRLTVRCPSGQMDLSRVRQAWLQPNTGGTWGITTFGYVAATSGATRTEVQVTLPQLGDPAQGRPSEGAYWLVVSDGLNLGSTIAPVTLRAQPAAPANPGLPPVAVAPPHGISFSPGAFSLALPSAPPASAAPAAPVAGPGASTSPASAPSSHPAATTTASHGSGGCCRPCCCCCCGHHDCGETTGHAPARPGVTVQPPPPGPAMPPVLQRGEPPPAEVFTQWLVEQNWPVLEDLPELRRHRFVISAQVLNYPDQPAAGELVGFALADDGIGDGRILGVGATPAEALRGDSFDDVLTGADGKAFVYLELDLWARGMLPTRDAELIPLVAEFRTRPSRASAPASPTFAPTMAIAAAPPAMGTIPQDWLTGLVDILVDDGMPAVGDAMRWLQDRFVSVVGVNRTKERVIGLGLDMLDMHLALTMPVPSSFPFPVTGDDGVERIELVTLTADEMKAIRLGVVFGEARGSYVGVRDTVSDWANLAGMPITLVAMFYQFVAGDPGFAAKVVLSQAVPGSGIVLYKLDSGFKTKVDDYIKKFTGRIDEAVKVFRSVMAAIWKAPGVAFQAIGATLYQGFEDLVGVIPTDYLGFARGSTPYNRFMAAFIAADILAFIVTALGIEIAVGYLTAGIGNVVSALAKTARLARVARLAAGIVEIFRNVHAGLELAKAGAARALLSIFRVLGSAPQRVVGVILDLIPEQIVGAARDFVGRLIRFFVHLIDEAGERLDGFVDWVKSFATRTDGLSLDRVRDTLRAQADLLAGLDRRGERLLPEGKPAALSCTLTSTFGRVSG